MKIAQSVLLCWYCAHKSLYLAWMLQKFLSIVSVYTMKFDFIIYICINYYHFLVFLLMFLVLSEDNGPIYPDIYKNHTLKMVRLTYSCRQHTMANLCVFVFLFVIHNRHLFHGVTNRKWMSPCSTAVHTSTLPREMAKWEYNGTKPNQFHQYYEPQSIQTTKHSSHT